MCIFTVFVFSIKLHDLKSLEIRKNYFFYNPKPRTLSFALHAYYRQANDLAKFVEACIINREDI